MWPQFRIIRLVGAITAICSPSVLCEEAPPSTPADQPPTRTWQQVQSTNETSIVHIAFSGTYENGAEDKWTGTGFIVSPEGHLLTCSHVLPPSRGYKSYGAQLVVGAQQGTVYTIDGDDLIDRLEDLDLVLFKLPQTPTPWHSIQSVNKKAVVHMPVMGLGFQLDQGLTYSNGEITNLRPKKARCWLTNAPLNKGMSGGPIFDQTGAVIAVVASGHPEAQLISEIIPINFAWRFFEEIDSPVITKQNQAVQQTAELVTKVAQKVEKTQETLPTKQLAPDQSAKADELLQKAEQSKDAWLAAYNKFLELSKNKPRRESKSERQEIIGDLKDTAQEYHATTDALVHLVSAAPSSNK
jgi:S1-C subfamily serine protease